MLVKADEQSNTKILSIRTLKKLVMPFPSILQIYFLDRDLQK